MTNDEIIEAITREAERLGRDPTSVEMAAATGISMRRFIDMAECVDEVCTNVAVRVGGGGVYNLPRAAWTFEVLIDV